MIAWLRDRIEIYLAKRRVAAWYRNTTEEERARLFAMRSRQRLHRLLDMGAPKVLIDNERRLLDKRERRLARLRRDQLGKIA